MNLSWLPPLTPEIVLACGGVVVLGFLVLRFAFGGPAAIARRWELVTLRLLALAILGVVLANPVLVDESPGPLVPAEVFVLLDTSESMAVGRDRTRWDEARDGLRTLEDAGELARLRWLRFGERVTAVDTSEELLEIESPEDPDTRLGHALRRLSSRFGRRPPASVVVVSDGRTRDRLEATEAAKHLGRLGVPVHVYATGTAGVGGDIGIVSVVLPSSARKFSEVEVNVFLRSFGYEGQRADLQLWALDDAGEPDHELDSQPITLDGGVQSELLTFRTDLTTRGLRVLVAPRDDEFDTGNNALDTELEVDRTKIRVLYVEGDGDRVYQVRVGDEIRTRGPYSDLQEALSRDPDVECVVVAVQGGELRRITTQPSTRAFPGSLAELFAFDAIVLSNVPARMFTEEQLGWIERWIESRGGGLCMVGGESSFSGGGWEETPIAQILPVEMQAGDWSFGSTTSIVAAEGTESHPILRIVQDARRNAEIVAAIPPFTGSNRWASVKPGRTEVLARAEVGRGGVFSLLNAGPREQPGLVVGRYGKGRTMALGVPITSPAAEAFVSTWGEQDGRYYAKFWQNAIYWLTESSSVGRRRLVVRPDKRYYRPGETIVLDSIAYDEGARPTGDYRIVAMLEPTGSVLDLENFDSPVLWPERLTRESGEDGAFVTWGEEFELPRRPTIDEDEEAGGHGIALKLGSAVDLGAAAQSFRVELTAYEDVTQVDSTSVVVQVIHDPFEHQNPLPDHSLLAEMADVSGGRVLVNESDLRSALVDLPVERGDPTVSRVPMWNKWWALAAVVGLLTVEWLRRRSVGLA